MDFKDEKIEEDIEALYAKITELEKGLSYDTNKSLKCDNCLERKRYDWDNHSEKCEVLHFSGYFQGKFNHHVHLCKDCIKILKVEMLNC